MDFQKTIRGVLGHRAFFPLVLVLLILAFLWRVGLLNPRRPTQTVQELGERAVDVLTSETGFSFEESAPGYEQYQKLSQGCPFKDCIPSIDHPQFESTQDADRWLEQDDVVFAMDWKGERRVYPQRILNWHEIVNDVVAGDPLSITFCPLCGSALAFDRKMDGRVLEFGVSGKLHNNDLVMYDRQTGSLWQQITGEAIVGELFGRRLTPIPMDTLRWKEWRRLHPDTLVLSRDTGFSRDYATSPYGDYEQDASPLFPVEGGVDTTLHPKAIVYGVVVDGASSAYPEEVLKSDTDGMVSDTVGDQRLQITYEDGMVAVKNESAGEALVPVRLFWFAWKAFHPETALYR